MDNGTRQNLVNLPMVLVVRVLSFLPNASCLSLLVAMEQSPLSFQSATVKAIVAASGKNWEILDFKDIQDVVGRSLTDVDIRWVLLAVDAVSNTKSLKLTHCFGITGAGLSPLRGSTVLERIDLSLVDEYESPIIDGGAKISVSHVVPVLNSILDSDSNSLVHVQFPKQWSTEKSDLLTAFLEVYNNVLVSRQNPCLAPLPNGEQPECRNVCGGELVSVSGQKCCYTCLKYICNECDEDRELFESVESCDSCNKSYCCGCTSVWGCDQCHLTTCEGCGGGNCAKCTAWLCPSCDIIRVCDHCGEKHCSRCSVKCDECNKVSCETCNDEHEEGIEACSFGGRLGGDGCGDYDASGVSRCFDCRFRDSSCPGCAQIIVPLLAMKLNNERRETQRLKRRIEQMEG